MRYLWGNDLSTSLTGGRFRGRSLKTPEGMETRPTSAKIRQALFNVLGHDLSGIDFLDLFAGCGSVGLEALSRGARSAVFVENSRPALGALQANIKSLGYEDQSRVISEDVRQLLSKGQLQAKFDLVFVDPPFVKDYPVDLDFKSLLKPEGILVLQYPTKQSIYWDDLPERVYKYGESSLAIFVEGA